QNRFSIHELYSRICREHSQLYNNLDATIASFWQATKASEEFDHLQKKWDEAYENRAQAAVIAITFAGMCLEAFFYDYAATHANHYSKSRINHHFKDLSLCAKLRDICQHVYQHPMEESSEVCKRVKQLSQDRNALVHFKSKAFDRIDPYELDA